MLVRDGVEVKGSCPVTENEKRKWEKEKIHLYIKHKKNCLCVLKFTLFSPDTSVDVPSPTDLASLSLVCVYSEHSLTSLRVVMTQSIVTNCEESSTYQALPICTRVLQLAGITESRAPTGPISTSSVPRWAGTKWHQPLGGETRYRKSFGPCYDDNTNDSKGPWHFEAELLYNSNVFDSFPGQCPVWPWKDPWCCDAVGIWESKLSFTGSGGSRTVKEAEIG